MCLIQVFSVETQWLKYSQQGDGVALSLAELEESSLEATELAFSSCLGWGGRNLLDLRGSLNFDGRGLLGSLNGRKPSDLHGSSDWEQ